MTIAMPKSPFQIATERTMGSQCETCHGTGLMTPKITNGEASAGKLAKAPCNNPNCTVNRAKATKLGRSELNILVRKDIVLERVKAVINVMPPLTNQYQHSEVVNLTNVKANELLDEVFEAAHQCIDEYQRMALIMIDINDNHYSFTTKDQPECGRLTTERKPKEHPTMDITKLGDVFDPTKTDDEVKAALKAAELDLTGSPDLPNAPTVDKPTEPAKPADPIGDLKKHLFKLLATQFVTENDVQIAERMKVALKADNYNDFIIKHSPIEKAREYGQAMIDEYLERNQPQRATVTTPEAATPIAGNPFQPATDDGVFLKMAIAGPSGSGKSFTSLKIATEMFPNGKIAFLCTEHKAARRYAKKFKFDLMEISDYHPQNFINAIKSAERFGYDALIIDSLSHEWSGSGGLLSLVDGKFGGWKEATPLHQKLIETIQEANIHIIVTMRSKMSYQVEQGANGKQVVRKMGLEPIQRDQTEYEFDIYAEIDMGSELTISKSRCFELKSGTPFLQGNGLAPVLKQWVA